MREGVSYLGKVVGLGEQPIRLDLDAQTFLEHGREAAFEL